MPGGWNYFCSNRLIRRLLKRNLLKGRHTMEDQKQIEEMTFREMMDELDGIVNVLESNTLELEDSLKSYERGIVLMRTLKERLNDAQQKVNVLMGELSGEEDDAVRDTTLSKA